MVKKEATIKIQKKIKALMNHRPNQKKSVVGPKSSVGQLFDADLEDKVELADDGDGKYSSFRRTKSKQINDLDRQRERLRNREIL